MMKLDCTIVLWHWRGKLKVVLLYAAHNTQLKSVKLGSIMESLWRNRLARSAVNRKVGGSNPPRDEIYFLIRIK